MSTNYETGHAKNVENFSRLDAHVISFGAAYAPADPRLQTANLTTVRQAAGAALAGLSAANPPYLQTVSRRETAFDNIAQLAARALHIAETLHLDQATINALRELVRKLYGRRAKPKKIIPLADDPNAEQTAPEHRYISVSQLSFDQRIEHFAQFVDILNAEPAYQPAETDLSVAGLTARLTEMRAANNAVTQAGIALTAARNTRNTVLYTALTGLVDIALDIKKYVRAAFGADSNEYNTIKGLQFKRIPK
jgi:hypothetical protein